MLGRGFPPQGGWSIPKSNLTFRPANPNSDSIDVFDCGGEWWEQEVNNTVRERKWDRADVLAYEFLLDGASVGFAFLVNKKYPNPSFDAPDEAYVRYIYTAGINRTFRAMPDPHPDSTVTVAESMFRALEGLPREVVKNGHHLGDVVGMFLTVYSENSHAQGFYAKLEYEPDVAWGERETGPRRQPTIAMRKPLP